MQELSLAVVGIGYANADGSSRLFEIALCRPGDPIELRLEPTNEHDALAVAVFRPGGGQLGYLTAERAPLIGAKLRVAEPCVAIFQGEGPTAAFIRARFDGTAPTLPQPRGDPPAAPDFYPDPDPPDWGA